MNKKFWLIITAFTISVPGFIVFSYWYLGIFSSITVVESTPQKFTVYAADHSGDYNKTGEHVVRTSRILASYAFSCKPILIYFDSVITTGKPYLRSAGGCVVDAMLPKHVVQELAQQKITARTLDFKKPYKLSMYGQTAVALRKVWVEIARLTDKHIELKFPLVQLVHATGENDFLVDRP